MTDFKDIRLEVDTSGDTVSIVVYEAYWDDCADTFLFTSVENAQVCADMERADDKGMPIQGKVRIRYVFI